MEEYPVSVLVTSISASLYARATSLVAWNFCLWISIRRISECSPSAKCSCAITACVIVREYSSRESFSATSFSIIGKDSMLSPRLSRLTFVMAISRFVFLSFLPSSCINSALSFVGDGPASSVSLSIVFCISEASVSRVSRYSSVAEKRDSNVSRVSGLPLSVASSILSACCASSTLSVKPSSPDSASSMLNASRSFSALSIVPSKLANATSLYSANSAYISLTSPSFSSLSSSVSLGSS